MEQTMKYPEELNTTLKEQNGEKLFKIEKTKSTSDEINNSIETKEVNSKCDLSLTKKIPAKIHEIEKIENSLFFEAHIKKVDFTLENEKRQIKIKKERNLENSDKFKKNNNFKKVEKQQKKNKLKKTKKNGNRRKSKLEEKESLLYKEIIYFSDYLLKLQWEKLDPQINPGSIFNKNYLSPSVFWYIVSNGYFPKFVIYKDLSNNISDNLIKKILKKNNKSFLNNFLGFLNNFKKNKEVSHKSDFFDLEQKECLEKIEVILKKKIRFKRSKNIFNDNVFFLTIRNKLFKLLEKKDQSIESMENLKKTKIDFFIKKIISEKKKKNLRINEIFSKIEKRRNELKYEEEFFARNINENLTSAKTQSVFHSKIAQTSILYNLKTFFVLEEKFLKTLENKAKRVKELNIARYAEKTCLSTKRKLTHNDMICYICNNPDYNDKNQIVFCSTCNVSVHQNCYQLDKIPKNDWICELCMFFGPQGKMVKCPFCPCLGGVLRKTQLKIDDSFFKNFNPNFFKFKNYNDFIQNCKVREKPFYEEIPVEDKIEMFYNTYSQIYNFEEKELQSLLYSKNIWAHLSCMFWNSKLDFRQGVLKNHQKTTEKDFSSKCNICEKSNHGIVVKCKIEGCKFKFHVECARRAKLTMGNSNSFYRGNCIFCPEHTPLPLKKLIVTENKRTKEDIKKYLKMLKRYLTNVEIEVPPFEDKLEIQEKKEVIKIEKIVDFFDLKNKRLFREVKEQLKQKVDWKFVIKLEKIPENENNYIIKKIHYPKKKIFHHKIAENAILWRKIGSKWDSSPYSLFYQFHKLKAEIQFLFKNQEKYIVKKEQEGTMIDDFIPNTEGFGTEQHCLCKKEWKGEVMVSCDRCDKWYHPKCLGFSSNQINQDFVFCFDCKKNIENELGIDWEEFEGKHEKKEVPVFKFALREDLNKILKENFKEIKKLMGDIKRNKPFIYKKKERKVLFVKKRKRAIENYRIFEQKFENLVKNEEFKGIDFFYDQNLKEFTLKNFF